MCDQMSIEIPTPEKPAILNDDIPGLITSNKSNTIDETDVTNPSSVASIHGKFLSTLNILKNNKDNNDYNLKRLISIIENSIQMSSDLITISFKMKSLQDRWTFVKVCNFEFLL